MHLVVPFAAPLSEAGRAALHDLELPQLQRLVTRLGEPQWDHGDEWSLSSPHERVLAQFLGLGRAEDGLVPLAALQARRAGLTPDEPGTGWALLTPCHWSVGTEQVSLHDPQALQLDEAESRAFLAAIGELFLDEGFGLHYVSPDRWLCRHPHLADLPTASLDRVIGRNVDRWLDADPRARLVRRLQNEVQMLLHGHRLNDAREARGALPLNSVWFSGTGRLPAGELAPDPVVDARLRDAALNEDWPRWQQAWRQLDAGPIAEWAHRHAGAPAAHLTLCGERVALTWRPDARSAARRLTGRLGTLWRRPRLQSLLEPL